MSRADWAVHEARIKTASHRFLPVCRALFSRVNQRLQREGFQLKFYALDVDRTEAEQRKKVASGRSQTMNSSHLWGEAVDGTPVDLLTGEVLGLDDESFARDDVQRAFQIWREEAAELNLQTLDPEWDPYHAGIKRGEPWVNPLVPGPDDIEPDPGPVLEPIAEPKLPEDSPTVAPATEYTVPDEAPQGARKDPSVGYKPRNYEEHLELKKAGKVKFVKHELSIWRHEDHKTDTYGITQDKKPQVVTGYLMTTLGEMPVTLLHQSDLQRIFAGARKGARAILGLLKSPVADVIAGKLGLDLTHARALAGALEHDSIEDQIGAFIDLEGSAKLNAWKDLAEKALEDDDLSEEEKAELLKYWL